MDELRKYKITYGLIVLNFIAYLFSSFLSGSIIDMELQPLVDMGALYGPLTVLKGEWWRLFSAMFLHGSMTHLLMNMFALYLIGRGVEAYFDSKSYFALYFFSGLIGGLASLYVHPLSVGVGASGAIFGLFGALAGFFLLHRNRLAAYSKAFMKDFAVIIVINFVMGFSIEAIDMSAHIGGLVIGFIGGFMISANPKLIWIYSTVMLLFMFAVTRYLPGQYAQTLF
ncbi:MAG: hypothetical protein P794_05465 [Epsilonproteobacteria bacterium (ex Lamellibrachia satsuma)]|nr:MAG: hypothetical protein P794_05465 [Epsilonproteobacteria bacterium (ex Lamellibrachia satsuma)]